MSERRPLVAGLTTPAPAVDPEKEKAFVFRDNKEATSKPTMASPTSATTAVHSMVPFSTRMRADFAAALKRASLERQLAGIQPNTLQDMLEQALEPWLRANGYLK